MRGFLTQTNFTGGIWSDILAGRVDLAKYENSVSRLENFIVWPHGPAQVRPGFRFIHHTRGNSTAKLIPFEFSTTQAYMLEFTDQKIRIYKDQAIITLTAQNITDITQANPGVVTYSGSDTYANGDPVILSDISGMVELNNREFTVANVNAGANTFELSGTDTSGYTAYTSGGTISEIYEITSPYLEADLSTIKYCQSNDVLYLFHEDYAPRKLSRTAHTTWTLTTINWRPMPMSEQGLEPDTTLTLGAVTGTGITFTAGASSFLGGDAGRLIISGSGRASIVTYVSATEVTCDIIDDFAAVGPIASGDWSIEGSPNGEITPSIKKPKGAICTLTSSSLDLFRSADVGKYILIHGGLIKLTVYTSATVIKGEILKKLSSTDASSAWTLESDIWSSANGYPSCGTFFEERLVVAGSTANPETVWGSAVGDYENHTPGTDDSDAFQFTLAGRKVSVIRWLEPRDHLLIGTAGGEWRLGPEDTGGPLTPLNVVAKEITNKGSANINPITINSATLFVQRAARKLLELAYDFEKGENGGYVAPDLTVLAEDITINGLSGLTWQQEPFSTIWCYSKTGELLGLTYLREEEVVCWHEHPIDGTVESISSIPGDGYDEVWAVINRTINSSTVRYVEMLEKIFTDDADTYTANNGLNAFLVDSGLTYNGSETSAISGLGHLEGETVDILADGALQASKTVSDGQITLSKAASIAHIGLGYTATLETQRIDMNLPDGTAQGREKRIIDMVVRVRRSGVFKVGRDEDNLDQKYDPERTLTFGQPYPLFTGDIRTGHEGSFNREGKLLIVQDKPMPLTILSIYPLTES